MLTPFYFIFKQHFRDYNGKYNPTCFSTGAPLDSPVMRNCANFFSFTVLTAWRVATLLSRAGKHKIKAILAAVFNHLTLQPRGFGVQEDGEMWRSEVSPDVPQQLFEE